MSYSEAHIQAFRFFQAKGYRLDGLTPAHLRALAEDPNFGPELAAYRRKVAADEAARAAAATTPAPKAAPPAPRAAPLNALKALTPIAKDTDVEAWLKTNGARAAPMVIVHELITELITEIAELKAAIVELKARPTGGNGGVKYAGIYDPQTRYAEGALVTRSGGLWLAQRDSIAETPGASSGWLLVVKKGNA